MKISRVQIENYRNLRNIDVSLEHIVAIIGENNSGKSNFLRALSLPLASDDAGSSKRLSWYDINAEAKNHYYDFLKTNRESIIAGGHKMMRIETYKHDAPLQAKARKHQSDFREQEMKVAAVPNTNRSGCYGNVISADDGASGVNFYLPFRDEIKQNLKGKRGAILTNVLRSEHIPYNIFFPMRHDLKKAALLFRTLSGKDVASVEDIMIEYAPSPKEEYLDDLTSFDTYVNYRDSSGAQCGIGIEVKYAEQGYRIGKGEEYKINDRSSAYFRVTRESGCFDYGGISEEQFIESNFGKHERGNDLRQLWRNHILGLSMKLRKDGIRDFTSVHLYPSFNEHFNPKTSTVLEDYYSLLNDSGRQTFMPLTYESLFEAMKKCEMDEMDEGWISYLIRRYIL